MRKNHDEGKKKEHPALDKDRDAHSSGAELKTFYQKHMRREMSRCL